jgi:hypothetical protein
MKRYEFGLIVIATAAMAFSYGYSIQPEPPAPQVVVKYVPVRAAIPLKPVKPISMSELMKGGR